MTHVTYLIIVLDHIATYANVDATKEIKNSLIRKHASSQRNTLTHFSSVIE